MDWNNSYTVRSNTDSFLISYSKNFIYSNGQTTGINPETNTHPVDVKEVGRNLAETAITNINASSKTTPSQVSFTVNASNNIVGNVYTADRSSQASAYVPYNFDTKLTIEEKPTMVDKDVIYAGEEKEIKYEIDVIPRTNPETTDLW